MTILLVTLIGYGLFSSAVILADNPLVTLEIRYYRPEAGEISLVWGVNDWKLVPKASRPAGTVIKDGVMYTPMTHQDDSFVATVQIPAGSTVDYGFWITKTRSGVDVSIWEADGNQDYHTVATQDVVIDIETASSHTQGQPLADVINQSPVYQEIRYFVPEVSQVFLVWGIDGWMPIPKAMRPAGTTLKDGLMYTQMLREGDAFAVKLQVPSGATVDFVFQMTSVRSGSTIEVWDTNGRNDYHTLAITGGTVEIQASPEVAYQLNVDKLDIALPLLDLSLLIGVAIVVVVITVNHLVTADGNLRTALAKTGSLLRQQKVLFMMIFVAVLYLASINTALYLWGDNAHYIIVGKALASGKGFRDIHYPNSPLFQYPIPMFPLVLSPIIYFFGYNLLPLKILITALGVGTVYLTYRLFRKLLDEISSFLLAVLVAVSPQLVSFSHQVMSEVPYLFLFLLAVIWIMKYGTQQQWLSWTGFITTILLAATVLTRTLGIALVLAVVPYFLWDASPKNRLQGLKKLGLLGGGISVVWLLMNSPILAETPYVREFLSSSPYSADGSAADPVDFVARIVANLGVYWTIVPETILYLFYKTPFMFFSSVVWILLGGGFLYCLVNKRTPLEYYLFIYAGILLMYEPSNIGNMRRYLVPVIPLLLYYFVQGVQRLVIILAARLKRATPVIPKSKSHFGFFSAFSCVSVLLLLFLFNLNSTVQASILSTERGEMFDYHYYEWETYKSIASWTRDNLPQNSVIMTRMPYFFHFWSGHQVVWYPFQDMKGNKTLALELIDQANADYIVVDSLKIEQSPAQQATIVAAIQDSPEAFQLVYQDDRNQIYHIRSSAEPVRLDVPLVSQQIRYVPSAAEQVFLVWGIDGWQTISEAIRPVGTYVKENLMYTPMSPNGSVFVTDIRVPPGATIDYVFQIINDDMEIWDTNNGQDYHLVVTSAAEDEAGKGVLQQTALPVPGISLVLLIGLGLMGLATVIVMRRKSVIIADFATLALKHRLTYLRDLLGELVARDLKLRYKRSVLGIAWSLLNPLAQLLIFMFLFRRVLPLNIPNYPLFVFSGVLVWTWFQASLFLATGAITDNRELIRRPGFPAAILPVVTVASNLIHFLLALPILFFFVLLAGVHLTVASLLLPLVIIVQFCLTLSLAYLVATVHVTFRDTQHLLGVVLLMMFYLTPVFYDAGVVPERYQLIYQLNPLAHLINAYRSILIYGESPQILSLLGLGVLTAGLLTAGYTIFTRASYRFVEEL